MARKKVAPEEVHPSDTWMCCLCVDRPVFEGRGAFFDHCSELHPELVTGTGSERTLPARAGGGDHVDATTWYSWEYSWMLADGRQLAAQRIVRPRAKNDPMRWA